jgi:hypothetical protein
MKYQNLMDCLVQLGSGYGQIMGFCGENLYEITNKGSELDIIWHNVAQGKPHDGPVITENNSQVS